MRWVLTIWFLQVAEAYEVHKAEEAYLWIDLKKATGLWKQGKAPAHSCILHSLLSEVLIASHAIMRVAIC